MFTLPKITSDEWLLCAWKRNFVTNDLVSPLPASSGPPLGPYARSTKDLLCPFTLTPFFEKQKLLAVFQDFGQIREGVEGGRRALLFGSATSSRVFVNQAGMFVVMAVHA